MSSCISSPGDGAFFMGNGNGLKKFNKRLDAGICELFPVLYLSQSICTNHYCQVSSLRYF